MSDDTDELSSFGQNPYEAPKTNELVIGRPLVESEPFRIGESPTDDDFLLGRTLLHEGLGFAQVREKLKEHGLDRVQIETVVTRVASELIEPLVIAGVAIGKIQCRLIERGMNAGEATSVIEATGHKHGKRMRSMGIGHGPFYLAACALILFGLGLGIGNRSGFLPTGTGAGFVLVVLGILVASNGRLRKTRTARS